MKSDFAGGKFPSGDFGENAAWWLIMVLSHNLNVLMKRLVLGGSWVTKRMKAVRFGFINIAGRVIDHARRLVVRISGNHPSGPDWIGNRSTSEDCQTGGISRINQRCNDKIVSMK